MELLITHLTGQLAQPLPGKQAQLKMATLRRIEELEMRGVPPADARVAAVMILLHRPPGETWKTVLIERAAHPKDRHSGQISLPGGSYELSDDSLEAVALREAHEEIGIPPAQIQVLGRLTELYIPVSNFLVHPFVGIIHGTPVFSPQPGEVAHILTPPMHLFFNPEYQKTTDLRLSDDLTIRNVPYFEVDGRVVWGATAMILSELIEILDPAVIDQDYIIRG